MVYKGLTAVSSASIFDPALFRFGGRYSQKCSLSWQKRISVLVYLALYLTYDNSAQFGVLRNALRTAIVTVGL